jgi:hypothetical protein
MTIHIQDSPQNRKALARVRRLAEFLGVSASRAAVIILDAAPQVGYEKVAEEEVVK